jgi:hypothetical protein
MNPYAAVMMVPSTNYGIQPVPVYQMPAQAPVQQPLPQAPPPITEEEYKMVNYEMFFSLPVVDNLWPFKKYLLNCTFHFPD